MHGIATTATAVPGHRGFGMAHLADAGICAVGVATIRVLGVKELDVLIAFCRSANALLDHLAIDQAKRLSCLAWVNGTLNPCLTA